MVQNFSFPNVKTSFSGIGQHVVKVHVDDVLQVRQLEEDNLVAELLEDGRGLVDSSLAAGSGGEVPVVVVPETNTVSPRYLSCWQFRLFDFSTFMSRTQSNPVIVNFLGPLP